MANEEVNTGRRRFLTATTAVVGAVGAGFAAVPFIKSWSPSARARFAGAPVTQDIGALAEVVETGERSVVRDAEGLVTFLASRVLPAAETPDMERVGGEGGRSR